ncbi:hypothetical protein FXO09_02245 [Microcystis aeruginosa KLA2]|jgi:hypothetical protein|nr:MAG: hypothetical protein EWV62_20930 [Microcystis aeruginosa Ma_OC_LR_19540900_S633]TYT72704.1 hypothetical protein FXO09_02245 [Microcystis aeruginosa KLA2]
MKTQGFEPRFSQNLAPVSQAKPQNPYLAYISHLFSKPYLLRASYPQTSCRSGNMDKSILSKKSGLKPRLKAKSFGSGA